jgi:glutaredoxin 3
MNVVVWSKYDCPYCDQAKALLQNKSIVFEERKIGDGWTKDDLLEEIPSARSLPQIIIDGAVIGGFKDLQKHFQTQEERQQ